MQKIKKFLIVIILSTIPNNKSLAVFMIGDITVAPEYSKNIISYAGLLKRFISSVSLKNKRGKAVYIIKKEDVVRVKPPLSFGVHFGYNILGIIEPTIGIKFCTTQKIQVASFLQYDEQILKFPLTINLYINFVPKIFALKFLVGYSFCITKKATYMGAKIIKSEEIAKKLDENDKFKSFKKFATQIDNLKEVEDFPKSIGEFMFGIGFKFPLGIYCNFVGNIPLDLLKVLPNISELRNKKPEEVSPDDALLIMSTRGASTPVFEFQLGINVMQIFDFF